MQRFWGRGAIAALALLAVLTVGSYAAGAHLGLPAAVAGVSSQRQAASPGAATGSNPSSTTAPIPPPGSPGPRGPRGRGPKGPPPAP